MKNQPWIIYGTAWKKERTTELVEASVEFAQSGTEPRPEDALKNVYA